MKPANEELQLFDLAADIGEERDLASAEPERVKELEKTYAAWNGELEEPRWQPAARNNNKKAKQRNRERAALNQ